MMSETGADEPNNGDSTFEIVDSSPPGGPRHPPEPPSALPDFASLNSYQQSSSPAAPDPVQKVAPPIFSSPPPPPSQFPPPPRIPSPSKTGKTNPYSIRAGATAKTLVPSPQPPVTSAFQPADPVSGSREEATSFSVPAEPSPLPEQYSVGLDMGSVQPLADSPLSAAQSHTDSTSNKSGVWGWIQGTVSGSSLLTKVAETAKNSVDSVITTLDPQMKDYMVSAGAVELAIASDKEVKINSVKEGFQRVFSQVVARGLGSPGSTTMAAQPVGFENGRQGAEGRIDSLRSSGLVPRDIPIVAVEGFLFETTGDRMFNVDCVLLDDPSRSIQLEVLSQAIQVPPTAVQLLKSHTPSDYTLKASGYAVTVGQAVAEALGSTPYDWQERLCGIPRRKSIEGAAMALAYQYRQCLIQAQQHNQ